MTNTLIREKEDGKLILMFPSLVALGEIPDGKIKIVGFWKVGKNRYQRGGVDSELVDKLIEPDLSVTAKCEEFFDLTNAYQEHFTIGCMEHLTQN